jgi:hypothetical protein
MKQKNNIRGETIAETLIALSVLAIGITLSSTLMASSLRNMNTSKNRVIAVNIAREGIEAVRNIRDTNWLRFSGTRRLCWNHLPGDDMDEACDPLGIPDPTPLIESGDYIIFKDTNYRWRLVDVTYNTTEKRWEIVGDPTPTEDASRLHIVDIDPNLDTNRDGNYENDADMYNHPQTGKSIGADLQPAPFFRVITIDYLDNNGNILPVGTSVTSEYNRMRIKSLVTWIRAGAQHRVELNTHLTDYLGRDNLES